MNDVRWTGETGKSRKGVGRIMKLRWIVGIIAMIALVSAVSAVDENNLVLAPAQGLPGDTVKIPITMQNAVNIGSLDFYFKDYQIKCDTIYTITSVEKGSLTQGSLFDWKKNNDKEVKISIASRQPITGSGTIAIVTVKVKDTAGKDGKKECYMHTSGDAYDSNNKYYYIATGGMFTLAPSVKGDGDHDGKVTTNDALAALQMAVGKTPKNLVYDMNGDNEVTARDVREILKLSVVVLAVPQPKSTEETGSTRVKDTSGLQVWKP